MLQKCSVLIQYKPIFVLSCFFALHRHRYQVLYTDWVPPGK